MHVHHSLFFLREKNDVKDVYEVQILQVSNCLYEDQAGKFDWRQQHVGEIQFATFDLSGSPNGRRIAVISKQNVVAMLNTKNGEIAWRQVLESDETGRIDDLLVQGSNVIVSQCGGRYLRSFSSLIGNLNWETNIVNSSDCVRSYTTFRHVDEGDSKQLVVLTNGTLSLVGVDSGAIVWHLELPDREKVTYSIAQSTDAGLTVIGRRELLSVSVVTVSYDGKVTNTAVVPANWLKLDHECEVFEDSLVCLDEQSSLARLLPLRGAKSEVPSFAAVTLQDFSVDSSRKGRRLQCLRARNDATCDAVVIWTNEKASVYKLTNKELTLFQSFSQAVAVNVAVLEGRSYLFFVIRDGSDKVIVRTFDGKSGVEINDLAAAFAWNHEHGDIDNVYGHVIKKKEGSPGVRLAVTTADHGFCLLQQTGRVAWCREEALSSIVAVETVDLPVSQIDAEMEEEFGSTQDSIPTMFVKRLKTQAVQLKEWVVQTVTTLQSYGQSADRRAPDSDEDGFAAGSASSDDPVQVTRDEFNLHKVIVAMTAAGKLFGLDSLTGAVMWQRHIPGLAPFDRLGQKVFLLHIQRTTAHFPYQPQAIVIGSHKVTRRAVTFVFNPVTGQRVEGTPVGGLELSFKVTQVVKLELMDEHFMHPLVLLDDQQKVHVIPSTAEAVVADTASSLYLFTADVDAGLLRGYGLHKAEGTLAALPLWSMDLQPSIQNITHVAVKNSAERVHSQGHVLADRNVLYKYVNPNLIAVVTEGAEIVEKQRVASQVTLYMVDAVTGHVVFQAVQKKAEGPVHLVHSENWVVLTYWSQKSRRIELSVFELYEGDVQFNSTMFSSFTSTRAPLVSRQSFVFPGHITALGVSMTERGLTNKDILFALDNGGLLELPKIFIDARRPLILTPQHREEGVLQYVPELPRPAEATINYNKSVFNIRHIRSFVTGLESTSLVLFYGLDVFGVRIMPSRQFDMLKEDFDYFAITSVLVGVIVASIVSQKLAARKALTRAWK